MENTLICQSCAMPLTDDGPFGTNADGSVNRDYCEYCFKDGKFEFDGTMDQMVEICVPYMKDDMGEDAARAYMKEALPKLKRWALIFD